MDPTIHHAPGRFFVELDGEVAYLAYHWTDDGTVDFDYTFVPPAHRHRRLGAALVRHALAWARGEGLTVIASCGFAHRVVDETEGGAPPKRW
jgi:hypothetical protein